MCVTRASLRSDLVQLLQFGTTTIPAGGGQMTTSLQPEFVGQGVSYTVSSVDKVTVAVPPTKTIDVAALVHFRLGMCLVGFLFRDDTVGFLPLSNIDISTTSVGSVDATLVMTIQIAPSAAGGGLWTDVISKCNSFGNNFSS